MGRPGISRTCPPVLPLLMIRHCTTVPSGMGHVPFTEPRLTTLLLKCDPLSVTSQPNTFRSTSCALADTSWPQPSVEPTLSSGLSSGAVVDGARLMFTRASDVFFCQKVYSRCSLLLSSWLSNPPSNSAERSGLRSGLPGWLDVSPGWSTSAVELRPVRATVAGANRRRPWVAPGCTPLAPYALRRRNSLSHE